MRILHAYNQHRSGGGATAVTESSIAILREKGHQVEVMTRRSADLPGDASGKLKAAVSAFTGGRAVQDFKALVQAFRPEVVHAHELFPLITPWILPECRRLSIPVVMSWNDYHMTCPARNHFSGGEVCTRCVGGHEYWSVLKNCRDNISESITMAAYCTMVRKLGLYSNNVDHYLVLSDFTRGWLAEHAGIPADAITANPPVVPMASPAADPRQGRYVAFGGRFVPEKGIDTLLEAARLSGVPVKLSRNVEHFVTVDLPPGVEVVVTRDRNELNRFYSEARAVVMPSIWFETFGVVAAEAMALGIPVVVSHLGAMANLFDDGVEGFYFKPGDSADLARKLTLLWNDPDLCHRMGLAGRKRVAEAWTAERHYETLMRVYGLVLDKTRHNPID